MGFAVYVRSNITPFQGTYSSFPYNNSGVVIARGRNPEAIFRLKPGLLRAIALAMTLNSDASLSTYFPAYF